MKNHTDVLNYLATTFSLQSYLEIGVQNGVNFNAINCPYKYGVDPDLSSAATINYSSDVFFKMCDGDKFDLIFIDGLHHKEQVLRDFKNSLKCLSKGGFIVIHDTLPEKEEHTHIPRDSRIWNGDVYKFACSLPNYQNVNYYTVDIDYGSTVIWKENKKAQKLGHVKNWETFNVVKQQRLKIITPIIFKHNMEIRSKKRKKIENVHLLTSNF